MKQELIRWPAVSRVAGISRTTVWRMERDGTFPCRRKISAHSVGWLRHEIEAWVQSRATVISATATGVSNG